MKGEEHIIISPVVLQEYNKAVKKGYKGSLNDFINDAVRAYLNYTQYLPFK